MIETVDFAKLAIVLAAMAALVTIVVYDIAYVWPLVRRVRRAELLCARLEQSAGVAQDLAERVAAAECRGREQLGQLAERLAQLEFAGQTLPYERAIGLAEQGESAEQLISYLGLSEGEADLVRLVHGGRASSSTAGVAPGY